LNLCSSVANLGVFVSWWLISFPPFKAIFLGSAAAPAAVNDALVADTNASHACFCLKGFRPPVCSARALNTARGARALPTP
jgi:hypothetical protein